tara:strand:- start:1002 stop:1175 length:174 start_codon:yes stop_codon:yes gene_type:complete
MVPAPAVVLVLLLIVALLVMDLHLRLLGLLSYSLVAVLDYQAQRVLAVVAAPVQVGQ